MSYERAGAVPLPAIRTVRVRGMDYARLQGITDVARAAGAGGLDVEEAHRRLDVVVSAPPTYRRTVHALGWVGMAASVAFLLGGGWLVALTAALTTALVEQSMRALNRRGLPLSLQQAVGAALATSVAALLVAWHVQVRTMSETIVTEPPPARGERVRPVIDHAPSCLLASSAVEIMSSVVVQRRRIHTCVDPDDDLETRGFTLTSRLNHLMRCRLRPHTRFLMRSRRAVHKGRRRPSATLEPAGARLSGAALRAVCS